MAQVTRIDGILDGLRSAGLNFAKAGMVRQEAEQVAGLRNAQAYNANMSGNKHGAQAESERFTLGQRQAIPAEMPGPNSPAQALAAWAFRNTGDTNMERFARAGTEYQTQVIRQQALDNVGDIDQMNRYNTLAKPGETYEPFRAVGNTGVAINQATGTGGQFDATLAKLFGEKTGSEVSENRAQATNALASAGQHNANASLVTERTTRLKAGTSDKPLTAAQLRENTAIAEARETLASMNEAEVAALMSKDSFSLTPGDRQLIAIVQRAAKPMYGEADVPTITPQPAPPAPAKSPGAMGKIWNWLTEPDVRPGSVPPVVKSAAPATAAPTMDSSRAALLQQAQDAIARGAPRDKVMQRLQQMGVDSSGL